MFESFIIVDSDEICFPSDPVLGCGNGFNSDTGLCSSDHHKPSAPILIPAHIEKYQSDFNPFPGNLHTISGVLQLLNIFEILKRKFLSNLDVTLVIPAFQMFGQSLSSTQDTSFKI